MSAVLREENNTELTVIETKCLSVILAMPEQVPFDFYKNPMYLENLKSNVELTSSLTYTVDEDGINQAKSDVAAMRKYAKTVGGFARNVFKSLTEKIKIKCDSFTDQTKLIESNADRIAEQVKNSQKQKLDEIEKLLIKELGEKRINLGVRDEFINQCADISSLVKLSGTLTPKGALTSKATGFIETIANGELSKQQTYDNRLMVLKVKCLENEINPPLAPTYVGSVAMMGTDEQFNMRVDELVGIELHRRAETVARVQRENEAANQKKIDDALKEQQAEAHRIAQAAANEERLKKEANQRTIDELKKQEQPVYVSKTVDCEVKELITKPETPESLRATAARVYESAQRADRSEDHRREMKEATRLHEQANALEKEQSETPVKKIAVIMAKFEIEITHGMTQAEIISSFESSLPRGVKDRLTKILYSEKMAVSDV